MFTCQPDQGQRSGRKDRQKDFNIDITNTDDDNYKTRNMGILSHLLCNFLQQK